MCDRQFPYFKPLHSQSARRQSPSSTVHFRNNITNRYFLHLVRESLCGNPTPRAMATANWRTINIDLLEPDSPANFPVSSLLPSSIPTTSASEAQSLAGQIKQLTRGGDTEGALRGALENVPYGGDSAAKVSKHQCEHVEHARG